MRAALVVVVLCASCGAKSSAPDDAAIAAMDLAATCEWSGAPGTCMMSSACAAMPGYSSEPAGSCSCCIVTPSVANDPPTPTGYKLMQQSMVTPAMTTWAVMILNDPVTYPMFSTATMTFGTQPVLARVEWHPPDFQNGAIHRGVTLYVPR